MNQIKLKKALGRRDIVLFCISAILILDIVASGAAMGPSSLFWWLFLGVVFFVPFALVSAELGSGYPEQGGIYAWVRRAHGPRWAARMTWAYWVNITVWLPSIVVFFAAMFEQVFWPGLPLVAQVGMGIIIIWLMVLVNVVTLEIGKWVPNLGAIIKTIVFLAIIVGSFVHFQENGLANSFTLETLKPSWSEGLQYLPAIIYGMVGFELVCAGSDEIHEPEKNLPRGVLLSGMIIIGLYLFATLAILVAIPADEINLVEGLVDTFVMFFGGSMLGDAFVLFLALGTLYTFFSNGVTWALGGNRATAQAAQEGELPKFFGIENRNGAPVGAAVALGITSTVLMVLYGFLATTNEDLFWSLFAFSGVIFLIPYIGMMTSFVTLRLTDDGHPRPFRIGGPTILSILMAAICTLILCVSIFLFNYIPGEGVQYEVLIGSLVLLGAGELCVRIAEKQKKG